MSVKLDTRIYDTSTNTKPGLEHIYYVNIAGFARSFYYPLLMAPVEMSDDLGTVNKKLALMARFLEMFHVLRSVNNRTLAYASIRYTMYNLIKEIRGQKVEDLADILKKNAMSFDEKFDGMMDFRLHHQNKRFVHFILARMTYHIEQQCGMPSRFEDYVDDHTLRTDTSRPFEIEHIWSDKFDDHRDEFSQREDFEEYRNMLGALILVPKGFNQSYGADSYEKKLDHYYGQNLLAKSLSSRCYEKNPSFLKYISVSGLPFKQHTIFKKNDIDRRQLLYKNMCEQIWSIQGFDRIVKV